MRISSGKLDQPITIQTLTTGVDGMGSPTETWATAAGSPLWAEMMPLRGIERIEAGKMEAATEVKFRVRRWASMTTKHQVIHSGRTYRILGIEDHGRAGDMVLHCQEVA